MPPPAAASRTFATQGGYGLLGVTSRTSLLRSGREYKGPRGEPNALRPNDSTYHL